LGNAGIIIGIMQSSIAFRTWVFIPVPYAQFCAKYVGLTLFHLWKCCRKYFQALLWITFGLSFVRFLGFAWYLVSTCFPTINDTQSVSGICMANRLFHFPLWTDRSRHIQIGPFVRPPSLRITVLLDIHTLQLLSSISFFCLFLVNYNDCWCSN
jgi:hypothetical protein